MTKIHYCKYFREENTYIELHSGWLEEIICSIENCPHLKEGEEREVVENSKGEIVNLNGKQAYYCPISFTLLSTRPKEEKQIIEEPYY